MTRTTTLFNASLVCAILLILTPPFTNGQRRSSAGRGSGVGAANGSGVGAANGSGVGTMNPSRRTAVIYAAAGNGAIGDGVIGDGRYGGRPGNRRNIANPGAAAVALSRRVPLGTVIEVLPPDCELTFIYEMEFYYCTDQYYQPMGTDTDQIYVAAEPYFPEQY